MPLIIGMDEAGYGPNLGPLVVTATAWEVPDDPRKINLWNEFDGIVAKTPSENGTRIQIADSKQVYTPARGLKNLETGVLSALGLKDVAPTRFQELWQSLATTQSDGHTDPWFCNADLPLPHAVARDSLEPLIAAWSERCDARKIRLKAVRSDIVLPSRFNAATREHDSKGQALTRISMNLLREVWSIDDDQPVLVIADKHGGRNRYQDFLPLVVGDHFIRCTSEGTSASRYRVREAEICFEMKAEQHFPVAVASMVSKYVRELAMVLFNRFWTSRLPGLKPTAGYPVDALRFRAEIAALQCELGISDDVLWRTR